MLHRMRCFIPLLVVALAGCSGGKGDDSANAPVVSTGPTPSAKLKVALLTPGPVSDSGWSAMAYDGLTAIKEELGAEINNREATGTEIKDALRTYAQQGYNLVFGHGYEYNEPSIEVAKDFPNVAFVSSSGGKTAANVGAFRFYLEQGFFLAGMLAADMSKTGKVAMIGGDDVPSIRSTFKAFAAGARQENPKVQVIEVFTKSGSDIAKAKQATLNAISQGADMVIHQANAAAQGVFDACKERKVYAFGANSDQNGNASGVVMASAAIVARPAFLTLARQVKDGKFKGGILLQGMDSGAIVFLVNPDLKPIIPQAVLGRVNEAMEKIKTGQLVVPKDEF